MAELKDSSNCLTNFKSNYRTISDQLPYHQRPTTVPSATNYRTISDHTTVPSATIKAINVIFTVLPEFPNPLYNPLYNQ